MSQQPRRITMSTYDSQIAELEGKLATLRGKKADEEKARRESVTPVYAYSLTPDERSTERRFHRIMDESVLIYRLEGTCVNQDEIDAVGGKAFTGSMSYFFNTASGKFICSTGGGSVFVQDGGSHIGHREIDDSVYVWADLNEFVQSHPQGGDVTKIILAHHERRKSL
jgi:hypothetical protein